MLFTEGKVCLYKIPAGDILELSTNKLAHLTKLTQLLAWIYA